MNPQPPHPLRGNAIMTAPVNRDFLVFFCARTLMVVILCQSERSSGVTVDGCQRECVRRQGHSGAAAGQQKCWFSHAF